MLELLLGILLVSSCGEESPVHPANLSAPPLEVIRIESAGITGVAPTDWVETYPGTFHRSGTRADRTVLVQRSFPGIDTNWLLRTTVLREDGPIPSLHDPVEVRQANGMSWRIHRADVVLGGTTWTLDIALAESATRSFVVALLSNEEDQAAYREGVFLPAVDEFRIGPEPPPATPSDSVRALFRYDSSLPLDIQESYESTTSGITEVQLSFRSPGGGRVPATLTLPEGDGPFPGMVIQHGLPSTRQRIRPLSLEYARKGVVTIAIDAPWARPEHSDRSNPLTFSEVDAQEQVQLIVDLSRAVDLLQQRAEVDPDQLVYLGVSYGGAMGGLFAGIESRLKAYVLVVGDGGLVEHHFGLEDVLFGFGDWGDALTQRGWFEDMWPVEPLNFVGEAAPAALLFQNGRSDFLVPAPDALRFQLFASEPKTVLWYDGGHSISPQMMEDQEAWLRQYIRLR